MKNTLFASIFIISTCMTNISYADSNGITPVQQAALKIKGQADIHSECIKKILNNSNFVDTFNKYVEDDPSATPNEIYNTNKRSLDAILQKHVLTYCITDLDRMSSKPNDNFTFPILKNSNFQWQALKPSQLINALSDGTLATAKDIKGINIPLDTILKKTPANVALVIAPYYSDLGPGKHLTRGQAITSYSAHCKAQHVLDASPAPKMNTTTVKDTAIYQAVNKDRKRDNIYYSISNIVTGFPGLIFSYYYTSDNKYHMSIPSYLSLSGVKYLKDTWVEDLYNTACKSNHDSTKEHAAYVVALLDEGNIGYVENSGYSTNITSTKKVSKDYYEAGFGELNFLGDLNKVIGYPLHWLTDETAITYTYKHPDRTKGIPYLKNLNKVLILGGPYKL